MHIGSFPSRRATALTLLAAGVFLVAGFAVTPWEDEQTARSYHDTLAAHPTQAQVAALLLHVGYLLLAPAMVGVASVVVRHEQRRRLLIAGAVLCVLGLTTMPGLVVTDAYDLALAQELPRATSAAISEKAGEAVLPALLFAPAMLGTILGPVLVLAAAVRVGEMPWAAPLLVLTGWVVPLAAWSAPLTLAGITSVLLGLAVAARAVVRPEPV